MRPKNQTSARNPALDGLRGIAILLVVTFHNFGFIDEFIFGWLGVDLFFVLSGFLITGILLKTVGTPHYLRNFFARRILRIFPLYYLSLIIFLVILPLVGIYKNELAYYTQHQWWLWLYLQNWLYSFYFTPLPSGFLTHYWSLAVEEQFYLLWPFVILWIRKPLQLLRIVLVILILVIVARFLYWIYLTDDPFAPIFTYTRIDGLCIGSSLAILHYVKSPFLKKYFSGIVLFLAAINFIFYFFNSQKEFALPYLAIAGYTTVAALFGLLLHEAVTGENKVVNFLFTHPVLRFFGKISYGFYIFHWPVYIMLLPFVQKWIKKLPIQENFANIIVSLVLTIAAIAISVISFYFFESYFLKKKKAFNGFS